MNLKSPCIAAIPQLVPFNGFRRQSCCGDVRTIPQERSAWDRYFTNLPFEDFALEFELSKKRTPSRSPDATAQDPGAQDPGAQNPAAQDSAANDAAGRTADSVVQSAPVQSGAVPSGGSQNDADSGSQNTQSQNTQSQPTAAPVSGSSSPDVAYEVLDPDVRLMLLVRDGNADAFEALVRKYQDRVLGVLHNVVSDREHAEDLAQDVFLRVYRARERYTPDAKFSTWLFTITHNVARNAIRQLSRRREVQTAQASASDSSPAMSLEQMAKAKSGLMPARRLDQLEIGEVVRYAMEALPERQRMALVLAKFEEMSYQDIGDTMGLTVQAVKSLLSRARNNLRDHLQPYLDAGRLPSSTIDSTDEGQE